MDPKGKGIVINDKEKESFVNEPKDDKPTDSGSGRTGHSVLRFGSVRFLGSCRNSVLQKLEPK